MKPVLEAGDILTCTQGHALAIAKHDIESYHDFVVASFDFVVPDAARNSATCPLCDAPYMKMLGTEQPMGEALAFTNGTPTGMRMGKTRFTGIVVYTREHGWIKVGQTGEEYLAEHPEITGETPRGSAALDLVGGHGQEPPGKMKKARRGFPRPG